jgi:flagellum-specific ATP synthase
LSLQLTKAIGQTKAFAAQLNGRQKSCWWSPALPRSAVPGYSRTCRRAGRIVKAVGNIIESEGPFCPLGECCEIVSAKGERCAGEVVGFRGPIVLSVPLRMPENIRCGDSIVTRGEKPSLRVGEGMVGRVIDAVCNPLDSRNSYPARGRWPLRREGSRPLDRLPITQPLG